MAIKLDDAKDRLEYMLKDISDVSANTFLYFCQNIYDYIYRKLSKVDPERFISVSNYSITSGTNSYSLPADYKNIQVLGTGLYEIDADGNDTDNRWTLTEFGSNIQGFYINGDNIVLTPDPNNATESARLRYIPTGFTFTDASTDYFTLSGAAGGIEVIPEEYMEFVVKALRVQYMQFDEDVAGESLADMRYIRELDTILDNIRSVPASYLMPDISQNF